MTNKPKDPKAGTREKQLRFRLSESERRLVEEAAERSAASLSEFSRNAVLSAARRVAAQQRPAEFDRAADSSQRNVQERGLHQRGFRPYEPVTREAMLEAQRQEAIELNGICAIRKPTRNQSANAGIAPRNAASNKRRAGTYKPEGDR